jgi:hypothetical protein
VVQLAKGDILGHEFCGIVDEVGPAVKKVQKGKRYVASFQIACGDVSRLIIIFQTDWTFYANNQNSASSASKSSLPNASAQIPIKPQSQCTDPPPPLYSDTRISQAALLAARPSTCACQLQT